MTNVYDIGGALLDNACASNAGYGQLLENKT